MDFFLLSRNLLGMISEYEKSYKKDYGVNLLNIMGYLYEQEYIDSTK